MIPLKYSMSNKAILLSLPWSPLLNIWHKARPIVKLNLHNKRVTFQHIEFANSSP